MDQSLEHNKQQENLINAIGFNPYFSGSVTGTLCPALLLLSVLRVSILILVDQSLEHFANNSGIGFYKEFQSLF